MRIPSSLHDDNLYRQRGRRAATWQPQRRLLRLFLALALVIVVMQQAGNPRIYELFFFASAANSDTASTGAPKRGSGRGDDRGPQLLQEPVLNQDQRQQDAVDQDMTGQTARRAASEALEKPLEQTISQIIARLDEATAKRLMVALAQASPGGARPLELPEDLIDALDTAARSAGAIAVPPRPAADAQNTAADEPGDAADVSDAADRTDVATAADLAAPPGYAVAGPAIDWTQPSTMLRLQEALDRWAIGRVDAASLWKAVDTLAFYRLLQEPVPAWLRRQAAARPSVISLLQQPDVYLHRRIAVPASVARAVHHQAAENPFGVSDYWELWLRPRDGSEQPLRFFTAEVPPEIAQVRPEAALADGPAVWVDGVYLKRLAHRSAAGAQLAPVLVGLLHPAQPVADTPAAAPGPQPSGWLLIGVSALLGGALAIVIFVQSRKLADRTRALRRATLPPSGRFLSSLSESQQRRPGEGP